jgi:transposase-like protein
MEYVGMQEIASAVGVTYNQLWVAVRSKRVYLRVDTNRIGTPVVADEKEIIRIRFKLQPFQPIIRTAPRTHAKSDIDVALESLIDSAKRLEERYDGHNQL